jgi:glycosyltransferase involved in cell wall biosynthesis
LLLEAAARLKKAGMVFQLTLLGDGPMRGQIEARILELGLGEQVELKGWVSEKAVREALLGSQALVLPSFAEGLPVVIMEAFALGRPVISTFVAGIPELVESGVSGWLVPAGSVDDLVEAMNAVLRAPPAQLKQMGMAGASKVAEEHDASREGSKLAELFRRQIEGNDVVDNGYDVARRDDQLGRAG